MSPSPSVYERYVLLVVMKYLSNCYVIHINLRSHQVTVELVVHKGGLHSIQGNAMQDTTAPQKD